MKIWLALKNMTKRQKNWAANACLNLTEKEKTDFYCDGLKINQ